MLRMDALARLRRAVSELLPGQPVIVFGSITKPTRFNADSDVDVALFGEPAQGTVYGLTAALEERVGRPVDVVLLGRCRFEAKIRREGELWTNSS